MIRGIGSRLFSQRARQANAGKFAQILNKDAEFSKQLLNKLNHDTKLRILNEILGSKVNGKGYTSYVAGRHRRAITVREVSLSLSPNTKEAVKHPDQDGDGVISSEELDKWLKSLPKAAEESKSDSRTSLTSEQKKRLFVISTIPFVGFGFLDNAVMIVAGDFIEHHFGILLGLSTLAAAGLGNLLSDVVGLAFGDWVENGAKKLGVKDPGLNLQQMRLKVTKRIQRTGSLIGIAVGCLLGMLPLLLMDTKKKPEVED